MIHQVVEVSCFFYFIYGNEQTGTTPDFTMGKAWLTPRFKVLAVYKVKHRVTSDLGKKLQKRLHVSWQEEEVLISYGHHCLALLGMPQQNDQ